MIIKVSTYQEQFILIDPLLANTALGNAVKFIGCPGRIIHVKVNDSLTECSMIVDIDCAFDSYIKMHLIFLSDGRNLGDDLILDSED